ASRAKQWRIERYLPPPITKRQIESDNRGTAMTTRHASCSCGQLRISCDGEPVRISVCHCLACQKRTGSPFGFSAHYPREQIASIEGKSTIFVRVGDSGKEIKPLFFPTC